MKESPFLTHKEILLQGYGAARTLRNITLSLWNGNHWPVDMSRVSGLDERHFAIAVELITWYRQHGANDPDFMDTGRACEAMALEAKRQAEQLKTYGKGEDLTSYNYEFFFQLFDRALSQEQAAIYEGLRDRVLSNNKPDAA